MDLDADGRFVDQVLATGLGHHEPVVVIPASYPSRNGWSTAEEYELDNLVMNHGMSELSLTEPGSATRLGLA